MSKNAHTITIKLTDAEARFFEQAAHGKTLGDKVADFLTDEIKRRTSKTYQAAISKARADYYPSATAEKKILSGLSQLDALDEKPKRSRKNS